MEKLFAPPHTHTLGRGLIRLTLHQGKLLMGAKLFSRPTQYQIFLLPPKINLFGFNKIAWCPWQPIGHCSWVICKQTQDRHLRAAHFIMDFFSLLLIQEKQVVSYWRNKMVAK